MGSIGLAKVTQLLGGGEHWPGKGDSATGRWGALATGSINKSSGKGDSATGRWGALATG